MQYLELGPVPSEESCAQTGQDGFEPQARRECLVFKRMLRRLFPVPEGFAVQYITRRYPHEFGSYFEVCVAYDAVGITEQNAAVCEFAFNVEANSPAKWDAIASYELAWFTRRDDYRNGGERGDIKPCEIPQQYQLAEPPALPAESSFRELLEAFPM